VIRHAAAGAAAGATREILAAARRIDQEFLARLGGPVARIEIPYHRIEPLREQRIRLGLETASRMLRAWRARHRARDAFAPGELERMVGEMLRLYAEETRALSGGVRLPGVLASLRERIAGRLHQAMLRAAASLVRGVPAATQKG
jgi:hypothetical protein